MASVESKFNATAHSSWKGLGVRLHNKALHLWTLRRGGAHQVSLCLYEIKRLELYKDLGDKDWPTYLARWGARRKDAQALAAAYPAFERFPRVMKELYPGVVSLVRVAIVARFCETEAELVWWARLGRLTTWTEFKRIVDGYREALRTGYSGPASTLIVAGVSGEHYEQLVKAAYAKAREELGAETTYGQFLVWASAKALGRSLPNTMGVDAGSMRRASSAQPGALPRHSATRPRLEGGIQRPGVAGLDARGSEALGHSEPLDSTDEEP